MSIPSILSILSILSIQCAMLAAGEPPAASEKPAPPPGWLSIDWPVRRTVELKEASPECMVAFAHDGLAAVDGRDIRVIAPNGQPTDFLIKELSAQSASVVFNASPGPGTYRVYYGNLDPALKPPMGGLVRVENSQWKPDGGYRGIIYHTRGPRGRQELRSFDDTKKHFDELARLTVKTEENKNPVATREVFYTELKDSFEEYGLIDADVLIPENATWVFGEGDLRFTNTLRVLAVDGQPVLQGWFEALSGGIISPRGQGKIALVKGPHRLRYYASGPFELKIAKEGPKLEFEGIGGSWCHFPKAVESATGELEIIPGKTLAQVCLDLAAAANAREFTRAKTIQRFVQDVIGDADPAARDQALRALDELESAAYRFNWMTEAKNPARTGYADEPVELPLKHMGGNRVFVQNSFGIEGITVAGGVAYMGEPFRLGPEPWPITSPPAIYDGVFYGGSKDCNLYACDLVRRRVLWRFLSGGPIYGGPVVYRERFGRSDRVYFCSLDGKLYCLDRKQGRMLWNYPTRDWIEGAPAIDAGRVFIASNDAALYCIDAELGVLRWQHQCDGPLASTPVVSDGTVFIGSGAGTMFAVEASSGKTRWQVGGNGPIVGAAASPGRVVFTSADGKLHSLNAADGKPHWAAADLAGPVKAPPIIVGSVAFAGTLTGEVKGVDLQAGTVAWSDTVRFGKDIVKPLAFMDGKLYVPAAGRGNGGYTVFGK